MSICNNAPEKASLPDAKYITVTGGGCDSPLSGNMGLFCDSWYCNYTVNADKKAYCDKCNRTAGIVNSSECKGYQQLCR